MHNLWFLNEESGSRREKDRKKNNSKSTCCRHLPTCNHLLFYFFSYTLLSVENRALNEKKISRMMRNEKSNLKVNWADYQWKQMVICVFFSPFLDLYAMACELLVPTHKRKICGDLFFCFCLETLSVDFFWSRWTPVKLNAIRFRLSAFSKNCG